MKKASRRSVHCESANSSYGKPPLGCFLYRLLLYSAIRGGLFHVDLLGIDKYSGRVVLPPGCLDNLDFIFELLFTDRYCYTIYGNRLTFVTRETKYFR